MGFSLNSKFLFWVLPIFIFHSLKSECCTQNERFSLLQIKRQFQSLSSPPNQNLLPSWVDGKDEDCCLWERVLCDHHPSTHHIVGLQLSSLLDPNLSECKAQSFNKTQKPLSLNMTDFYHIEGLKSLNLSFNCVGSLVPDEGLCKLRNLQVLDLSWNSIVGRIPKCINNLTFLEELHLSRNNIVGYIPPGICKLRRLRELYIGANNLNGSLPTCIGNLSSLQMVGLAYNQLSGSIPSGICKLRKLQGLVLSDNNLNGELPACIGNLTSLEYLDLSYNHNIGGNIPSGICKLRKLQTLDLDDNILNGELPACIGNLTSLEELDLSFNHNIGGNIPSDLGPAHYFWGIEFVRKHEGFYLSQSKHIRDLVHRSGMDSSKPIATPMATDYDPSTHSEPVSDPQSYRSVVGSLQYLAFTRPDVSFAVNKVCQTMHDPRQHHWQAVKRILRYLNATVDLQFHISSTPDHRLSAYSDADWGSDRSDRRSVGAYCIFHGSNLVSWSSKKQDTVARSTTEAEYRALAQATCETIWLQSLFADLQICLPHPPVLWCDNLGATYLAVNPVLHHRIKHLDMDYHFVRERVQTKTLQVAFISSKDQVADLLTKPLSSARFTHMRSNLCLRQLGSREDSSAHKTNTQPAVNDKEIVPDPCSPNKQ